MNARGGEGPHGPTSWLDRQRNVLDHALFVLRRGVGRNLSLLTVYTLLVFLLASVLFFTHALKREAFYLLSGAPEIAVQKLVAGRYDPIPTEYGRRLAGIRGVAQVRSRLWGYYFDPVSRANWTLMVPPGDRPAPGTIFVGSGVSRLRKLFRGDPVPLRAADGRYVRLTVEGSFAAESELVSADLVLVSEADFRRLFALPEGLATDLVLTVRNPREVDTVAAKVQRALPDTRVIRRDDIRRTYDAVLDWRGGLLLVVLSVALLAFLILVWDKASGLSAEERREIGILKAVGWETSDVLLLKAWEGAAVTVTAFLVGTSLAYAHVFLAAAPLFAPVLKGWSVLYPDFRPAAVVDAYDLGVVFLLSVLPYTAATIVPSWRAATVDPDNVMRS